MKAVGLAGLVGAVVLVMNAGPLADALTIGRSAALARQLLPDGWRDLAGETPAAWQAAQSADQRALAQTRGAAFVVHEDRVVLAVPRGLDSDLLDLRIGCFLFLRREIRLIVWQLRISSGCL